MTTNKIILGLLLVLLANNGVVAQTLGEFLNEEHYNIRVKLVDEFFNRFNGKELRLDIKPETENVAMKNLLVLFNAGMFTSLQDSAFFEAKAFAQRVLQDSIKLNYNDTTWLAKATCHGKLKGKDVDFVLYLNVENRRGKLYKWVIAKAEGDIFKLAPSIEKETIMLMPDDHETNFMSLRRITTEKDDYILNYKQKQYSLDETSVFYGLVYTGILDIEYVKPLEFIFFQVPGYIFAIRNFERENYNTGWLISSLKKIGEEEKTKFLNYIYNK